MVSAIEIMTRSLLRKLNLGVTSASRLEAMEKQSGSYFTLELLRNSPDSGGELLKMLPESRSQIQQDLFVLSQLGCKRGGYFVEFGAADGMNLSNTYLLEKEYGWTGIVAEPARGWHEALKANRSCHIETDCVWRESNATLNFCESDSKEYSTIDSYHGTHENSGYLKTERSYSVKTISLVDLLAKYNAPARVDYLSIDTEGSEYEILSNYDFGRYGFSVITVEHNFTAAREKLFELLTSKGYLRKFEEISRFDDWYVLPQ